MPIPNEDNFTVTKFTGLFEIDGASSEYLEDRQLQVANNVFLWKDGTLRKRWPIRAFTALSSGGGVIPAILYIGQLIVQSGLSVTIYTLLQDAGANVTYYTQDNSQSVAAVPGMSGPIVWDCVQYNNKMYFACEDGVYVWNPGSTATKVTGSPPGIRRILTFRDRLFGCVNDTVYYTAAGDPNNWAAENFFLVGSGDGDTLVNMCIYNGTMVIAKKTSLWQLHFADDPLYWYLNCVHASIGVSGNKSMKVAFNLIYFMTPGGMYVTDLVTFSQLYDMGEDRLPGTLPEELDIFDNTVSVYKDWIIYSSRGFGLRAFHRDQPQGFTQLSYHATVWGDIREQVQYLPNSSRILISIGPSIFEFCPYDDATSDTPVVTIRTKSYDIGRISYSKRLKYATLNLRGNGASTATYQWYRDNLAIGSATAIPSASNYGVNSSVKITGPEFGRTFGIQIVEVSKSDFVFYGFDFILHEHRQQTKLNEAT